MSYEQVKDLPPTEFNRYCGVSVLDVPLDGQIRLQTSEQEALRVGQPTELPVEDPVLMTLEYWREYRTFFHVAKS